MHDIFEINWVKSNSSSLNRLNGQRLKEYPDSFQNETGVLLNWNLGLAEWIDSTLGTPYNMKLMVRIPANVVQSTKGLGKAYKWAIFNIFLALQYHLNKLGNFSQNTVEWIQTGDRWFRVWPDCQLYLPRIKIQDALTKSSPLVKSKAVVGS